MKLDEQSCCLLLLLIKSAYTSTPAQRSILGSQRRVPPVAPASSASFRISGKYRAELRWARIIVSVLIRSVFIINCQQHQCLNTWHGTGAGEHWGGVWTLKALGSLPSHCKLISVFSPWASQHVSSSCPLRAPAWLTSTHTGASV